MRAGGLAKFRNKFEKVSLREVAPIRQARDVKGIRTRQDTGNRKLDTGFGSRVAAAYDRGKAEDHLVPF
jgi:hypothetical protein